jgi:hypothetical protein
MIVMCLDHSCYHNERPLWIFCVYGVFDTICGSDGQPWWPGARLRSKSLLAASQALGVVMHLWIWNFEGAHHCDNGCNISSCLLNEPIGQLHAIKTNVVMTPTRKPTSKTHWLKSPQLNTWVFNRLSGVSVQFWTMVQMWTGLNWTTSPVQSACKVELNCQSSSWFRTVQRNFKFGEWVQMGSNPFELKLDKRQKVLWNAEHSAQTNAYLQLSHSESPKSKGFWKQNPRPVPS